MTTSNPNIRKALDLLKGKTVVAHDRRAATATAIDYSDYRLPNGVRVLSPAYGVSNTMHKALAKLADKVKFVDGMPRFHFYTDVSVSD